MISKSTEEAILKLMPMTHSKLVSRFVAVNSCNTTRYARGVAAKRAIQILKRLRSEGKCDFEEILSKDGTRVLKRTWKRNEQRTS